MIMCVSFSAVINLSAQVDMQLAELGMENIRMAQSDKGIAVAFEDRAFRSSYEGVGHAIKSALEGMTEDKALRGLFLFVSIRYQAFHILLFYKPLSVPFYTILPKRQTYIWVLFRVLDF